MRPAIAAIYAFARRADDFADETGPTDEQRLRLLEEWRLRLHACARPAPRAADPCPERHRAASPGAIGPTTQDDLIFIALGDAIRRHRLPVHLLEDLLSAFRQDVTVRRYATWADVLDYCRRSANPIGRLVLRVAGYEDPVLDGQSDAICTALQLTNFWQDFGTDWQRGRLYLPDEDRQRSGADEQELAMGRWTDAWRHALSLALARTRQLFVHGRPLCDAVSGRLRWELRMTWLGGSRILDKIEAAPDPLSHRPHLTPGDVARLFGQAAMWRSTLSIEQTVP